MANESLQLYQSFIRKGMQKQDAFFAVIDHFNDLHWHDRNRQGEEIKQLKARVAILEGKGEGE
jgi:hypothetical protein